MKICPQCHNHFPKDYVFCLNDGTLLDEDEQETLISDTLNRQPTTALAPEMLTVCAACHLANRANSKFCKKCGALLVSAPAVFQTGNLSPVSEAFAPHNTPADTSSPPDFGATVAVQIPTFAALTITGEAPFKTRQTKKKFPVKQISAAAVIIAAVAAGIVLWYVNQPHPAEAELDRAITNNQLIAPDGDNADEYYHQLKKDGADAKILRRYEDRLLPLLTTKPDEVLKTVVEPGVSEKRPDEWQSAVKMLDWAVEMRPADAPTAAKAAYCRGRVNYLNEQKEAAIADWKRAADLDKKWALPLNGIGLIYNERKDYDTARTWLRQATEREPNWAIPYNNLGTSYYYQNRFAEAAPFYQKAVEIAPHWARPHAWLASVAMKNFDCASAVGEFEMVFAPDAVGASEMNLDSIRKQYEKAKSCSYDYGMP